MFRVGTAQVILCQGQERPLDLVGAPRPTAFQPHQPFAGLVTRHVAGGLHRIHQPDFLGHDPFLEQVQHQRRRAKFQRQRVVAHVGVADQQVQATIFPVIGQRLVAGVDNRAVELHPLVDVVDDVIGALGNLEPDRTRPARTVKLERQRVRLAHPPGTGKDLARGQERQQPTQDLRRELRATFHQVVLVTAERRAGMVIDVVFQETNLAGHPHLDQRPLQQQVARPVIRHDIPHAETFRRGVFQVPHVEVQPPAVEQKPAVARRFLVIAVMQIDRTRPPHLEQVVLDVDRIGIDPLPPVFGIDQAAVLGLETKYPIHRSFNSSRTCFSSNRRNRSVIPAARSRIATSG